MTIEALTALSALLLILGSLSFWFREAWALWLPENRAYYVAAWLAGVGLAVFSLSGSPGWWRVAAVSALVGGALFWFCWFFIRIDRRGVCSDDH